MRNVSQKDKEYIYLDGTPIALVTGNALYFIHTDHLGTPREVTNAAQQIVWQWYSTPFGQQAANDDPDGNGAKFEMNLRFPGQYFDQETGLHYNYFRDYDPGTGRYITSDPIGLGGGLNTYAYVDGNPLSYTDPLGLKKVGGRGGNPSSAGVGDSCGCLDQALGIETATGAGLVASGQPTQKKRFRSRGSSRGTSIASSTLSKVFPQRLPVRLPAPTTNRPFAKSNKVGRVLGRWVPFVGWVFLGNDMRQFLTCISNCEDNECKK